MLIRGWHPNFNNSSPRKEREPIRLLTSKTDSQCCCSVARFIASDELLSFACSKNNKFYFRRTLLHKRFLLLLFFFGTLPFFNLQQREIKEGAKTNSFSFNKITLPCNIFGTQLQRVQNS